MGCATGLVKAIVFVFNFIFVLAGIGLIGIGTMYYLNISAYKEMVDTNLQIAPTLVLIIGIIVFIIAFFGCCGACKDSYCMLVTYAVLLLTLFAIQLAIGIYAYLQVKDSNNDINPLITDTLEKSFKEYDQRKEVREWFDLLQRDLHCCGVHGPIDYVNIVIPASCCGYNSAEKCLITSSYVNGCANKLSEFISKGVTNLAYVAGGIAIVEIIGAIFAICLAMTIKNESRRRYP